MALERQRNLLQNEHGANESCHLTQKDGSTLPSKIKLPQKCLKCSLFIMLQPQRFFTDLYSSVDFTGLWEIMMWSEESLVARLAQCQ